MLTKKYTKKTKILKFEITKITKKITIFLSHFVKIINNLQSTA